VCVSVRDFLRSDRLFFWGRLESFIVVLGRFGSFGVVLGLLGLLGRFSFFWVFWVVFRSFGLFGVFWVVFRSFRSSGVFYCFFSCVSYEIGKSFFIIFFRYSPYM